MEGGRLRPAIAHADLDKHVLGTLLRILHEHVKVAVVVEDACVQKLVFEVASVALPASSQQIIVGKSGLGILVQILHVGMRWRAVQIEVILFDVLTVVAFAVGQTEEALLEDRVFAVPESQAETKQLMIIADACKPVLAPVIRARTRLVMAEVVPGIAVLTVVFPHGAPLALTQVRPPFLPRRFFVAGCRKAFCFCVGTRHCVFSLAESLPRNDFQGWGAD